MRKKHTTKFKARVAIEAIKGERTIAEIASEYKIHPNMVTLWKKKAVSNMSQIFEKANNRNDKDQEKENDNLFKTIGKMKIENEWLKKKLNHLF